MEANAHQRFADEVGPHLPALRAYVDRRDPQLTDDVMQELSVVAWRRLDEIPLGSERAWLFGVARMVLLAERRKATERHARVVDDEAAFHGAPVPDSGVSASVARPLAQALVRLSDRDRDLLLLTAWEGLSTNEAAQALGIRATAVRMGLVRARRRLATALDELDPGWDGKRSPTSRPPSGSRDDALRTKAPEPTAPPTDAEEAPPCDAARA